MKCGKARNVSLASCHRRVKVDPIVMLVGELTVEIGRVLGTGLAMWVRYGRLTILPAIKGSKGAS